MVRVITVHNFLRQNITQIEEPTASCIANASGHEMLLLALPTHCVKVWELMMSNIKLHTVFPTVDMINQMVHCTKGDYVAALESKLSRDSSPNNHTGKSINNFVRIYVNWAIVKDQSQPMRARIAGRVTPSLNRPLNTLEMIELPLSIQPTAIACCQSTGNLLVALGNSAILHEFKIETQQVSKMKYIDFEARPWSLGFSFNPTHMEIVEDFISIMDKTNLCIFRLTNSMYEDIDQLSSLTSTNSSSIDKTSISTDSSLVENSSSMTNPDDSTILQGTNKKSKSSTQDLRFIISESNDSCGVSTKLKSRRHKNSKTSIWSKLDTGDFRKIKSNNNEGVINLDHLIYNERDELQRLIDQEIVDTTSQALTINLPSISLERAGPGHTLSPFVLNPSDIRIIIKTNSPDLGWSENYTIKNLLSLKIVAANNNPKLDGSTELFSCSLLKPLYMRKECNNSCLKKSILRSDRYTYLQGVSCFLCTLQEGYLYHFSATSSNPTDATCLTTYPFTAPVNHVALEHSVLHALTEAGLESYTLRLSHHVARSLNDMDDLRVTCPSVSEPICLIGLRPFLGIQQLLHSRNYLVLLAKAENSWTLYSLILPKLENLYYDILNAARSHKSSSPSTYRHLLGEAHALIRLAKDAAYNCSDVNEFDDTANKNGLKLKNLYNQSCALLGDYYIRSECESDWDFCIPYYKMSGLKPSEVLSRKSSQDAPGLITFLTDVLLTMKSGSEADALFQGFNIVEIIRKLKKPDLLKLIFNSPVLREYTAGRLIHLLLLYETKDEFVKLALTLLFVQAEKEEIAERFLESVPALYIKKIVVEHWDLLFDMTAMKKRSPMIPTFSDFAGTLMRQKNSTFADILIELIEDDGVLSLHQIIQVFLEYLPSRVGRDGHNAAMTLQVFLEKYLHNYFSTKLITDSSMINKNQICTDFALVEAFKLLVRSYFGKLTQTKVYKIQHKESIQESCDNFMFAKFRPHYLNGMPPYAKDYQKVLNMCDLKDLTDIEKTDSEKTIPTELFKLQSVLSCDFIPNECLYEVKQFLETQEIDGSLSLKTLCIQNTEEVTALLMENCPQAVVQYAKDMYTKDTEWKYLIELTQSKISSSIAREEMHCLYTQIMKAILNYLPHTLSLKSLHHVLPKDDVIAFQKCSEMCNQIMHAEHVKSLIMETGQQLSSTLKL
ncbi:BLOC-2 complex member HPS3 [Anthophora quadrimaculata]